MKLQDIVLDIREEVPDVPAEFVETRFIRAARQFFNETRAWRDDAMVVSSTGTDRYLLLPDDGEVLDVVSLRNGSDVLAKTTLRGVNRQTPTTGKPREFYISVDTAVVFPDPGVSIADELSAVVALTVARSATDIPDEAYERFEEYLRSGTLGRLMTMPGRPWTTFDVGRMHLVHFEDGMNLWRSRGADGGQVGVPRRVKYGGY